MPYLTDTRLLVPPLVVSAGEMMDSFIRTSMSQAKRRGESPAPASFGRHPTQRYPSLPCPVTSESGLYRRPVADTPFSIDPFAARGGRSIVHVAEELREG